MNLTVGQLLPLVPSLASPDIETHFCLSTVSAGVPRHHLDKPHQELQYTVILEQAAINMAFCGMFIYLGGIWLPQYVLQLQPEDKFYTL